MVAMDGSKDQLSKQFGKNLRKHRVAAGMSQQELAERCELDRTYISLLERGLRTPTLYTLMRLSAHLNISASDQIRELEASYNTDPDPDPDSDSDSDPDSDE